MATPGVQVLNIRNRYMGLMRYLEVPLKITVARWRDKPDAYVITFRGYEMLLFMVMTLVRKPIIFDEMVNFTEWMEEHRILKAGTLRNKLFRRWYAGLAKRCSLILADTEAHAQYSAELNRLDINRYSVIPIGTDETVFYPRELQKPADQPFTVFYYGHMLPLHGLSYVLDAALLLKDQPDISFRLVGGKAKEKRACEAAAKAGARVMHEAWLPFDELASAALMSNLTLGGPFGNTMQSQFVITGKTYQFLALGVPVLIGQNRVNDLFQDKMNCLAVPQADAKAIAAAITWGHDHPEELKRIGQAGHQLYQTHFSQEVINGLVKQLVKDLNV